MEGEYYRTWFYFSVTGVPQGELLTFTFKNLSNQVSFKINLKEFVIRKTIIRNVYLIVRLSILFQTKLYN